MSVFNGMFPILQGKEDRARAFAAEVTGPRRAQWVAMHERYVVRETWSLQQTPMGSFFLVWFDGDLGIFADQAQDNSEFATWYKGQILDLTGVDLSAPLQGPMPEIVLEWTR